MVALQLLKDNYKYSCMTIFIVIHLMYNAQGSYESRRTGDANPLEAW